MALSKKDRLKVFGKYNGKCSYCGCELTKSFHIDHFNPLMRGKKIVGYSVFDNKPVYEDRTITENDCIENMMPACVSCNLYKSTFSLEQFREQIGLLVGRLNARTCIYKIAKRYKLIEETNIEVKFYFETITPTHKTL